MMGSEDLALVILLASETRNDVWDSECKFVQLRENWDKAIRVGTVVDY